MSAPLFTLTIPSFAPDIVEKRCHWLGTDSSIIAWCEALGVSHCIVCLDLVCDEHIVIDTCVNCISVTAQVMQRRAVRRGR